MKDRFFLGVYLAAVITATMVHDPRILAAGLAGAAVLAGRRAPRIAVRAFTAVVLFQGFVLLSYGALSLLRGGGSAGYVLLAGTRVFTITFFTFLVADRVNLFRALAFSRTLSSLLVLAWGQIATFRRVLADFRLALESRAIDRPAVRDLFRHGGSAGAWFLRKSLHSSAEITQAMKSRGFRT
ncbi:MAG: ABC transporter permease [Candidatus Eisenbacteria bacterium]